MEPGTPPSEIPDPDAVIGGIRELCGEKDRKNLDFFLKGFDAGSLNRDFYEKAFSSKVGFIRDYYELDLNVRNIKTVFLNRELGRKEDMDVIPLETKEFEREKELEDILHGKDILERERGMDDFYWEEIDSLTAMEVFSFNLVLSFIAKLKIIGRWTRLNPDTGRELFRKFTEEIRSNR